MSKSLLIIGKTPPPIGGVTIHVQRLLGVLNAENMPYTFIQLNVLTLFLLPYYLFKYSLIHLHTSNLKVQFFAVQVNRIFKKKLVITFHGDLSRYSGKKHELLFKILKKDFIPVVLNDNSYSIAKRNNDNAQYISAFLPPLKEKPLSNSILKRIEKLEKDCEFLFGTNASTFSRDKFGNEIYGIIALIGYFNENTHLGLVISDSSGEYKEYIHSEKVVLNANILLISEPHSFFNVLDRVDAFIRNTTTDGDSLSVWESLFLGKLTFATNVVSRPEGTITYSSDKFPFSNYKEFKKSIIYNEEASGAKKLIQLYRSYI